jgi:hypothetical protein
MVLSLNRVRKVGEKTTKTNTPKVEIGKRMQEFSTPPRPPLASLCDRCGGIVPQENSILHLEEIISGPMIGQVRDRHLYPVDNCPGSPSRVKLVESNSKYSAAYQKMKSKE